MIHKVKVSGRIRKGRSRILSCNPVYSAGDLIEIYVGKSKRLTVLVNDDGGVTNPCDTCPVDRYILSKNEMCPVSKDGVLCDNGSSSSLGFIAVDDVMEEL
jgi:hypothetical protein